jgi:hypothetical protein
MDTVQRLLGSFWRGELERDGRSSLSTFELPRFCNTRPITPDIAARLRGLLHEFVFFEDRQVGTDEEAWMLEPDGDDPAMLVKIIRVDGREWIDPIYRIDANGEVWVTVVTSDDGVREIPTQQRDRKYLMRKSVVLGLIAPEQNWMDVLNEHLNDMFVMLSKRRIDDYGRLFKEVVLERALIERSDLISWATAHAESPSVRNEQPGTAAGHVYWCSCK